MYCSRDHNKSKTLIAKRSTALARMNLSKAYRKKQTQAWHQKATSLSQVVITILQAKPDDSIVQDCYGVASILKGQSRGNAS